MGFAGGFGFLQVFGSKANLNWQSAEEAQEAVAAILQARSPSETLSLP